MKKILFTFIEMGAIFTSFAQPANDIPCNAINITVDTIGYNLTCIPAVLYSWTFANPSLGVFPAPSCGAGNAADIWFKMTVPTTGTINIFTSAGNINNNLVMEAYTATACGGSFTSKGCNDDYNGSYPALFLNGLTPSSILYLRVWVSGGIVDGDIRICATSPGKASDPSKKVGIGTTNPFSNLDVNGSAIVRGELKIESITKGLILPRLSLSQLNNFSNPIPGTVVYNTTDSSLYIYRNSGWTHVSSDWASNGTDIFNTNSGNVGIGNLYPMHARLEINGTVGAAVAMFGADRFGVTIEANNPEVGFNYFFSGVPKTIKAGRAAVIGMVPSNGDVYIGNFSDNVSSSDFGAINGYQNVLTIKQNGRVGILTDATRAAFEQKGVVGNTAAIFGGEGAGISLQKAWPAIGFNHYYDGINRSIAPGWLGQLALSQTDGSLAFSTFGDYNSIAANDDMGALSTQFFITRKGNTFMSGNLSVNNTTDGPPITIRNTSTNFYSIANSGIRFQPDGNFPWNIYCSGGAGFNFAFNNSRVSYIAGTDGTYYSLSDSTLKKSISNLYLTLDKINMLRPVSYLMKEDKNSGTEHIGFLSQEVEKIFPEVVTTNDGIKLMNYSGLIPVITKGIQEQQQLIKNLQKENSDLKARLELLEKMILKN